MNADRAEQLALAKHPECTYASSENGMDTFFRLTWVVSLWRNAECCRAGDPPRHVIEGFLQHEPVEATS